jgi:hypothetical protein
MVELVTGGTNDVTTKLELKVVEDDTLVEDEALLYDKIVRSGCRGG